MSMSIRQSSIQQKIVECLDFFLNHSNHELIQSELTLSLKEYHVLLSTTSSCSKLGDKNSNKEDQNKIQCCPVQKSFWAIRHVDLHHRDLAKFRLLVMVDTRVSHVSTIQFSLIDGTVTPPISLIEQTVQLLYQGCIFPLDGRKSRKPKFLLLEGMETSNSAIAQVADELGIQLCHSALAVDHLNHQRQSVEDAPLFRQCSVCQISGTPNLFYSCDKCGAVLYCRKKCQRDDWEESHHDWCSQFKQFMALETELGNLPFSFTSETTQRDFDETSRQKFMCKHAVRDRGLWLYECSSTYQKHEACLDANPDEDNEWDRLFCLEKESSLLQYQPPRLSTPLCHWSDYYSFRGFELESPIAVLLHFPLTLYFIISQLLPFDYGDVFSKIQESKQMCVYIIGAEKEVAMFYPFLEFARLFGHLSIQMHLFGNNFDKASDGRVKTKENLSFKVHMGLYHKVKTLNVPCPDLAVCFNGGLGAYTSYIKTVRRLMQEKVPFYYTDYGQASIAFSKNSLASCKAGRISDPQLNPFRSPLRVISSDQNLPRYSNAFISHVTSY